MVAAMQKRPFMPKQLGTSETSPSHRLPHSTAAAELDYGNYWVGHGQNSWGCEF
jgi:hypothetical protein